ncbi:MAG: zf-HC2 domain-containing protein [Candidatus Eremiobacteraeota bacterium]|nr:zf-HC2 domain-containing protein [Candidatus Eremiobacteraeota bacterium]
MNRSHVGDDAELYVIGALEPAERAEFEAHLEGCTDCAKRVADASQVATALAMSLPAYEPPHRLGRRLAQADGAQVTPRRRFSLWAVVAATAVAFAGVLGWQDAALYQERARTTVALATIVHSHFRHVTMTSSSAGPAAKVLYARDGAWVYIVVDRPVAGVRAVLWRGATARDAGALQPSGGVSTLFVSDANRPERIVLHEPLGVTASATLTY